MEVTNDRVNGEKVIILDCGSQFGKLIDRKIRELNVESDLYPSDTPSVVIKENKYRAIIISGGPNSVCAENAPNFDPEIFKLNLPILGICYGMQLINKVFGGEVTKSGFQVDGTYSIEVDRKCPLFKFLNEPPFVLLTHGDKIERVASNMNIIAKHEDEVVGIGNDEHKIYGLLFHPEVDLTSDGKQMIGAFLYDIAGLSGNYRIEDREIACINYIKRTVGDKKKVLMMVSGGVDSTICVTLLLKALGPKNIMAIHIDNGFMRKNESEQVKEALQNLGVEGITVIEAKFKFKYGRTVVPIDKSNPNRTRYTKILCKLSDPEEKRKIIGDVFVEVANSFLGECGINLDDVLLAQGTLRPDLIESASSVVSSNASVIKTHHNDTDMIRKLRSNGQIVEPLRDFHKDEVRLLGEKLGLPYDALYRHPFPGPGLAIRVLCGEEPYIESNFSETQVLVKLILNFDLMLKKRHALLHRIENVISLEEKNVLLSRSARGILVGTVLPIRTVGVQGDHRTYSYVVGISRAEEPSTVEDWDNLFYFAQFIPRICPVVNRVCYISGGYVQNVVNDITPTYLTMGVLSTIRQADYIANKIFFESEYRDKISQMPVILIPIHFDRDIALRIPSVRRSIVIRPVITKDFMTALAAKPGRDISIDVVTNMLTQLRDMYGISRSLYDMTNKPPGTIEWE